MADSLEPWIVRPDPKLQRYSFFLSHVAEDKPFVSRVRQLVESRLRRAGSRLVNCFIDARDWPRGRPALLALQDAILASAHTAVFVTPDYLHASRRGWTWIEFALAYLIDAGRTQLHRSKSPYIVPIFRGVSVEDLGRTPLVEYWHSNLLPPGESTPAAVAEHLAAYFLRAEAESPYPPALG